MKGEQRLLQEKIDKIEKIYMLRKQSKKFIPVVTYIPVLGKVMGENDMSKLIDESLDRWIISGRYVNE